MTIMPDIAFANGVFLPLSEATVSVEDRGFQFGDGVYELLRVYGRVLLRPLDHLARLERSARALGIALPFDTARWMSVIAEAVHRSDYPEAKVYIQVTRGVAPRDHTYSATLVPTVIITVRALAPPVESLYTDGTDVVTVPDLRWGRCDIKSVNLLANVLAKQEARNAGAFEAVFVRDGFVLEGATSNVMAVHGGSLVTPPEGPLLLSGVTRHLALQLAREAGISLAERPLQETDLYTAGEVFLTGTTVEILPVKRINERCIGGGVPGPITKELMARFRKLHA
jgi:D-alanine transaminase